MDGALEALFNNRMIAANGFVALKLENAAWADRDNRTCNPAFGSRIQAIIDAQSAFRVDRTTAERHNDHVVGVTSRRGRDSALRQEPLQPPDAAPAYLGVSEIDSLERP